MSQSSTGLSKHERAPRASAPPLEAPADKLIYKGELLERIGVSYPTIWSLMRKGEFPRARVVGGKSAWLSSEIDEWIARLPRRRLKGDADAR